TVGSPKIINNHFAFIRGDETLEPAFINRGERGSDAARLADALNGAAERLGLLHRDRLPRQDGIERHAKPRRADAGFVPAVIDLAVITNGAAAVDHVAFRCDSGPETVGDDV